MRVLAVLLLTLAPIPKGEDRPPPVRPVEIEIGAVWVVREVLGPGQYEDVIHTLVGFEWGEDWDDGTLRVWVFRQISGSKTSGRTWRMYYYTVEEQVAAYNRTRNLFRKR